MKGLVDYINESLYVNEGFKDKWYKFKENVKKTFGKAYDPRIARDSDITADDILNAKTEEDLFDMIDELGAAIVLDGREAVVAIEVNNNEKHQYYGGVEVRIIDKKNVFEVIYQNENSKRCLGMCIPMLDEPPYMDIFIKDRNFREAAFDILKYDDMLRDGDLNVDEAWDMLKKMFGELKGESFEIINTGKVNPFYYTCHNII